MEDAHVYNVHVKGPDTMLRPLVRRAFIPCWSSAVYNGSLDSPDYNHLHSLSLSVARRSSPPWWKATSNVRLLPQRSLHCTPLLFGRMTLQKEYPWTTFPPKYESQDAAHLLRGREGQAN